MGICSGGRGAWEFGVFCGFLIGWEDNQGKMMKSLPVAIGVFVTPTVPFILNDGFS